MNRMKSTARKVSVRKYLKVFKVFSLFIFRLFIYCSLFLHSPEPLSDIVMDQVHGLSQTTSNTTLSKPRRMFRLASSVENIHSQTDMRLQCAAEMFPRAQLSLPVERLVSLRK